MKDPAAAARARAAHLVGTGRFDLAEPELRRALALDPNSAELHAMLSISLVNLDRTREGLEEAERAVASDPDDDYGHFARAVALQSRGQYAKSTEAALEAVRLNPDSVRTRVRLADTWLSRGDPARALEEVDRALALDPEYADGLNVRGVIRGRQGHHQEGADLLDAALALDPENGRFHANRGWVLLEGGRESEAQDAFREALRLRPGNEWARAGILEALKARNAVYRWLLRISHWLGRMSTLRRWAVLVIGFFVSSMFPPLFGLYFAVLLMGWIGEPLYNVVLFTDQFGRSVLTRDEKAWAVAVPGCLWGGLAALAWGLSTDVSAVATAGGVLASMSLPVSTVAKVRPGSRGRLLTATLVLAALGVGLVVSIVTGDEETEGLLGGCYVLGLVASAGVSSLLKR